jgi:hypothetical protein
MDTKFLHKCWTRLSSTNGAVKLSPEETFMLLLAKKLREPNHCNAGGRCFSASLAFASAAKHKGILVSLIRWTVLHDEQFADHWAIRLNEHFAVDLTSIQFDTSGEVLQRISSYPPNFVSLREYPFEIFSNLYTREFNAYRFSARMMWGFYKTMLRYDLRCAYLQGRLLQMPALFIGRIKECFPLIARSLSEWVNRSLNTLHRRFNEQKEDAKTTSPGLL